MIWSINAFPSKTSRDMTCHRYQPIKCHISYIDSNLSFYCHFFNKQFVLFATKNGKTSTSMQVYNPTSFGILNSLVFEKFIEWDVIVQTTCRSFSRASVNLPESFQSRCCNAPISTAQWLEISTAESKDRLSRVYLCEPQSLPSGCVFNAATYEVSCRWLLVTFWGHWRAHLVTPKNA